jgi:hypothetical protein
MTNDKPEILNSIISQKSKIILIREYAALIFPVIIRMLYLPAPAVHGQTIPEGKSLQYDSCKLIGRSACPSHKMLIDSDTLITAFYRAMFHYPELCGKSIKLKHGRIRTSMAAQPRIWSLVRKRENRKYRIVINKDVQGAQNRLLYMAPFDAQVGVMGHEIAHILDYSDKSGWRMICTGIRYLCKNHRRAMERQTDSLVVARGLGWQLYRYAYFVIHEAEIDEAYRNYKRDFYMKPEEIYELMID